MHRFAPFALLAMSCAPAPSPAVVMPEDVEVAQASADSDVASGTELGTGPMWGAIALSVDPTDRSTSWGTKPLRIWLNKGFAWVPDESVKAVAPVLRLQNTDGTVVPTDTKIHLSPLGVTPEGSGKDGGNSATDPEPDAYVDLVPKAPLASQWHEIVVTALPEGVVAKPGAFLPPEQKALPTVRFHPGSAPTPTSVALCSKAGKVSASVKLSEVVLGEFEKFVTITPPKGTCTSLETPVDVPTVSVRFTCTTDTQVGAWQLALNPGVKGVAGGSLAFWPPIPTNKLRFDVAEKDVWNSCAHMKIE